MTILDRAQLAAMAEVDPWKLQAQLQAGDPAQIEGLAAAFYRAGGHAGDAVKADAQSKKYVGEGYTVNGGSPLNDNAEVARTSKSMVDAAEKLPQIGKLLAGVGQDLEAATKSADTNVTRLNAQLSSIERQWDTFMQGIGHHLPPDDQDATRNSYIQTAVSAVRSYGGSVQTTVMNYEHTLAGASKSMSDLGYVAPAGLREAGEQPTPALPVGTPPIQVAKWWASLTPAQQEYLIDHDYSTLGQLKGLPAPVLDTSNRHRISDDETTIVKQMAGLDPNSAQYKALQAKLMQDRGISTEIAKAGPGQPPVHTFLLTYDPNAPEGQTGVVISYGNPDTADNTGLVVPGTGNNAAKLEGVGKDGRNLYDSMTGQSKAVVVWLDGPEPQSVLPQAGSDSWANESAPRLVTDIAGLRAAHLTAAGQDGHLTMIGHSYGSYIAGKAMTQGAKVDDVVFVGSPGVGVNNAKDLGIDPSHVWDGEASDDPILLTEKRFTPDPMNGTNPEDSGFGAQHFSVSGSHGHSEYYDRGSESVTNMAAIASGDYSNVDRVDAPDYRGARELPGDLISTVTNPFYTQGGAVHDLVTGHPISAVQREWNGAWTQGSNLVHDGEDVGHAAWTGVKNTAGGVVHGIESWGESMWP